MQRNGNYPLISSYEGELVNVFCLENSLNYKTTRISLIQDSIIKNEENYIIESDDEKQHTCKNDLAYLYGILDKVFKIVYIFKCILIFY